MIDDIARGKVELCMSCMVVNHGKDLVLVQYDGHKTVKCGVYVAHKWDSYNNHCVHFHNILIQDKLDALDT